MQHFEFVDEGKLERFLDKVDDKLETKGARHNINEQNRKKDPQEYEEYEEFDALMEELRNVRKAINAMRREMRKVVKEEIENILEEATIITENAKQDGGEMHIIMAGHHFKGKMKIVKK